jgi:hypothetical protein
MDIFWAKVRFHSMLFCFTKHTFLIFWIAKLVFWIGNGLPNGHLKVLVGLGGVPMKKKKKNTYL